jgi:hypothetical protein
MIVSELDIDNINNEIYHKKKKTKGFVSAGYSVTILM